MPLTMTEEREAMIRCQSSFAEDDLFAELDAERAAHQRTIRAWEEKEAACCPEDVGFPEYITSLKDQLARAYRERDDSISKSAEELQRTKDALAQSRDKHLHSLEIMGRELVDTTEERNDLQQQLAQSQEVARKLAEVLGRLRDSVNADQSQLDKYSSFDAAYAASNAVLSLYAAHRSAEPRRCQRCNGTGSIPNGTDEMACGDCTGTGVQPEANGKKESDGPPNAICGYIVNGKCDRMGGCICIDLAQEAAERDAKGGE